MMFIYIIIPLIITTSTVESTLLPPGFVKCNEQRSDFDLCLLDAIEFGVKLLKKPVPEVNLPSLEPLELPQVHFGGLNFTQRNIKLYGLTQIECLHADFTDEVFKFNCTSPKLKLDFDGEIYLGGVFGTGPGTILLDNVNYVAEFNLGKYQKGGEIYFKASEGRFRMKVVRVDFGLSGMFGGDRRKASQVKDFFTANWRVAFKPSYESALAQVFSKIFDDFLGRVSKTDLIGNGQVRSFSEIFLADEENQSI